MWNERADVRAQRDIFEMVQVIPRVIPVHCLDALVQHGFGDILDPGEAVDDGVLRAGLLPAKAGAQAAVAHQHGGRPVPDHFRQTGFQIDFQVQVGVNIQQAGQQPLALRPQ